MNLFSLSLRDEWITRLGWTLLHFVWQGAALALVLAAALIVLRNRSAAARYMACCVTLLLMTVCPPLTFVALLAPTSQAAISVSTPPIGAMGGQQTSIRSDKTAVAIRTDGAAYALPAALGKIALAERSFPGNLLPWVVFGWSVGVVLLCVRLAGSSLAVYRLTCNDTQPVTEKLDCRLRALAGQMGIARPIRLMESSKVGVPTVIGCLRAVILLPVSTVTRLPQSQVEALIAHELAHIRRYDHLFNLWQVMLETVLFYHPAVWWVSRQVRIERENSCDDLVLEIVTDRTVYARALASLATQQNDRRSAALASNGGELLPRIRRILGLSPLLRRSVLSTLLHALLCVVLLVSSLAWQASPTSKTAAAHGQKPDGAGAAAANGSERAAEAEKQRDYRASSILEALAKVRDHYQSLSSFTMRIENHYTSGLFPTEYTQTLRWRKPDQFELLVTSKLNTVVPDYRADGRQLITVVPDRRRFVGTIAPEPNTEPGWEVSAGYILSWLQNTQSGGWLLDGKTPSNYQVGPGPRTTWHGYHVRELLMKDTATSKYYPHGISVSFFLDADKPILIGLENNCLHRIGWALYADQQANPALPQMRGQVSTTP